MEKLRKEFLKAYVDIFSFTEIKNLMPDLNYSWYCHNDLEVHLQDLGFDAEVPWDLGGNKPIDVAIIRHLETLAKDRNWVNYNPNRVLKRCNHEVYTMNDGKMAWLKKMATEISAITGLCVKHMTLYDHLPPWLKKFSQITGACKLCLEFEKLLLFIRRAIGAQNFENLNLDPAGPISEFPTLEKIRSLLIPVSRWTDLGDGRRRRHSVNQRISNRLVEKIMSIFKKLQILNEHVKLKTKVYNFWKNLLANFPDDLLVILVDYKNPFDLGRSANQTGDQEWNYQSGPIFGLVLIYKEDGILKRLYIPMVINRTGAHTGYQSTVYTEHILKMPEVLRIARLKKKLFVGMDGGSHFVCKYYLFFVLFTLHNLFPWIELIRFLPFAKYHGKSDVDRLFAIITCWYWSYIKRGHFLGTVEDLVDAFKHGAALSKKKYAELGLSKLEYLIPEVIDFTEDHAPIKFFLIENIKSTYAVSIFYQPNGDFIVYNNGMPELSPRSGPILCNRFDDDTCFGSENYKRDRDGNFISKMGSSDVKPSPDTSDLQEKDWNWLKRSTAKTLSLINKESFTI